MDHRATAIARYNQHVEEVKAAVSPERLLIFKVDQGWKPLCDFLGLPVPDGPFPNVNDRNEIKKIIADMTKGAIRFSPARRRRWRRSFSARRAGSESSEPGLSRRSAVRGRERVKRAPGTGAISNIRLRIP